MTPRIYLSLPSRGACRPEFRHSLMLQVHHAMQDGLEIIDPSNQPLNTFTATARNISCVEALACDADYVLMWDDDMTLDGAHAIAQMVNAGKPVVVPLMQSRHSGILVHGMGAERPDCYGNMGCGAPLPRECVKTPGLYQIGFTGSGIILISTEVLYALMQEYRIRWINYHEAVETLQRQIALGAVPKDAAVPISPRWSTPWFETWCSGVWLPTHFKPTLVGMFDHGDLTTDMYEWFRGPERCETDPAERQAWRLGRAAGMVPYRTEQGEDGVFSHKCREIGAGIWLDSRITTRHFGTKEWNSADVIAKYQGAAQ